jgi:hypothetical protein
MAEVKSRAASRAEDREQPMGPVGFLRAAASSIIGNRARLSRATGKTFDGDRDIYEALGYQRNLAPEDYRERYDRNAIAGRVVDIFPDETWVGSGELVEDPNAEERTTFEEEFDVLARRLDLWPTFNKADKLARLGEFSVILIGAPGKLDTPLGKFKADKLAYLSVFGQEDVKIEERDLETNEESPRWGQPNFYNLTRAGASGKRVHYTRIIHVAEGRLDDKLHGRPALQRIWNNLDDLEKLVGGGAEAFWMRANQGYVASIDPAVRVNETLVNDLKEQVEEFAHNMRRTIGQQGIKLEALGSDTANFDKNAAAIIDIISAGTEIPQRLLVGSERGQLASSQDAKAWKDRISNRRVGYAAPVIVHPFVDRLIEATALPKPKQYEVRWPEIDNLSEGEQMALAEKAASVNQKTAKTVITVDEIRDRYVKLPPLEEVDPEAAAENDAPKEPVQPGVDEPTEEEPGEGMTRAPREAAARRSAPAMTTKEKRVARAFAASIKAAQDAIDLTALEDALATNDAREAQRLLSAALSVVGAKLDETLPALLLQALIDSGKVAAKAL